ncbi:CgeB family protein [Bradyrhizobium erythrophlei]|uniref:Spore maturation protein CgeB n=1 Tax=Bradyrhizobium erythrophlei TaxID=1437360 RepID=A0A1M7UHG0_9BRAD|nr:glycosyltransferase [Bradyrhizobium erythrophlei]SHN82461.1 spore maturation protein CgeB [Bradyrhizobium erythrophlei]
MKILCVLSRFAYGRSERGENYDYVHFVPTLERLGHEISFFDSGDRSLHADFAALNVALLERVVTFQPDVIFCVLMHYEIWFDTLDLIRANSPALIVNWGTDDSWKFAQASRFFAGHVDLHVTTDRSADENARSWGIDNVMLSQWAASETDLGIPRPSAQCGYDVSFVGSMYGYRATWIESLRRAGVSVACFGHRTENGVVDSARIPEIFRASRISLNFSGAGQNPDSTKGGGRQIKARTFEVPGAGGFLLTEVAPGLERYFIPNAEIATFSSPQELVARARYFLEHTDERDTIARAGHARTRNDHTYEKRFAAILVRLLEIGAKRKSQAWTLSPDALTRAVSRHRRNGALAWLRTLTSGPLVMAFGRKRGPRAARRLLYELSWRICGATTYRASGVPGRLFYHES